MEISREQRVKDVAEQLFEGAITYIEFFRFCASLLTEEDEAECLTQLEQNKG